MSKFYINILKVEVSATPRKTSYWNFLKNQFADGTKDIVSANMVLPC